MTFTNENLQILGKRTVHTKNLLGFRGLEPPVNFDQHHIIFAVGGSATECFFLSDSNCCTNRLCETLKKKDPSIWINNAGFQGHSTYDHNILINDYLKHFHPDCILMMTGYQ